MRHCRVPVLTEEYAIHVYVGPLLRVNRLAEQRLARAKVHAELPGVHKDLRGIAWNCLPEHNPIIAVASGLPRVEAQATLAHEASHAMGFFCDALGLDDPKGEFRAHGVAAVMRVAEPLIRQRRR